MSTSETTKSDLLRPKYLFSEIREILINARKTAYKAINFSMVTAYWNIGRLIVEDEQQGNSRAEYGKTILADLAKELTIEFGKGFSERELRRIRQFYLTFPKWDALRPELTWTHYRLPTRISIGIRQRVLLCCTSKIDALRRRRLLCRYRYIGNFFASTWGRGY